MNSPESPGLRMVPPCRPDPLPAPEAIGGAALQARRAMLSSWHVAVVEGPDAGVVLALPERGEVVLGRGAILTDPYLSRRQLRVRVRGRRIEVCTPAGARPVTPTGGAGPGLTGLRPRRRDARTWSTWPAGHRLRAGWRPGSGR